MASSGQGEQTAAGAGQEAKQGHGRPHPDGAGPRGANQGSGARLCSTGEEKEALVIGTTIAIISALLLVAGFVWWRIEKNLGSQQVVSSQSDEIERTHAKLAAEQAERVAKAKADQEAMYADAQRIAEISDADERRKAAL